MEQQGTDAGSLERPSQLLDEGYEYARGDHQLVISRQARIR
jgi:hypothetical protein